MLKITIPLCAALLTLSGCATVSPVVPIGGGSYLVGISTRGGLSGDAEVKAQAIQAGQAFCSAKQMGFEMVSATSSGIQGWTPQNAEVIFRCVGPDAPR